MELISIPDILLPEKCAGMFLKNSQMNDMGPTHLIYQLYKLIALSVKLSIQFGLLYKKKIHSSKWPTTIRVTLNERP